MLLTGCASSNFSNGGAYSKVGHHLQASKNGGLGPRFCLSHLSVAATNSNAAAQPYIFMDHSPVEQSSTGNRRAKPEPTGKLERSISPTA